ncbi:MAG TPA: carbon monoxide dehydrogenase subunit G [Anaerolineales bacterium]|nr:carbon monoxide dehydrogenase subunit G [Anaerolineales bacterium]
MKLVGEYTFDGPREEVWKLIRDPEVLSTALPGTQSLEQVSENEYQGEMNVRVGPVGGVFMGRLTVSDEVPPESLTMTVEGKGKPGFLNGSGHVQLIAQEDGRTLMKYDGEVQIGGRLASVGQRLIDTASKSIIGQALDTLNQASKARLSAQVTGQAVEYKPPSETEFAASVAKDMAGEVFSSSRLIWIGVAVLIIIIILAIFLISSGGS